MGFLKRFKKKDIASVDDLAEQEIAEKINHCSHPLLKYLGKQETGKGGYIYIGNCLDCSTTRTITKHYLPVVNTDMYIHKDAITKGNDMGGFVI